MPKENCYCARCRKEIEVICPGCGKNPAKICTVCVGTGRAFVFQFSERAKKRTAIKKCERCGGKGWVA
jgi:hypothetical protein